MVRVPVGIDNIADFEPLVSGACDKLRGGVRGIDQRRLSGLAITEQIAKIPISTGTNLFKDKLHESLDRQSPPFFTHAPRLAARLFDSPPSVKTAP